MSLSPILHHHPRPSLSVTTFESPRERSVASLENEIMRLQEVLKEREAEITILETSLLAANTATSPRQDIQSPIVVNGDAAPPPYLSPNTLGQFEDIKTMVNGRHHHPEGSSDRPAAPSEPDESLDRLNELMLFVSVLLPLLPWLTQRSLIDRWRRKRHSTEKWLIR